MAEELRPKIDEAIQFLEWLRPGGPWLLVAIAEKAPLVTRRFTRSTSAKMRDWIDQKNRAGANIYYHVNPTVADLSAKAKKPDVTAIEFLFVDIDPDDTKDADDQRREFQIRVEEYPIRPSAIVSSGNGIQALWRLRKPIELMGEVKLVEQVEAHNRGLIAALDADIAVHDVCRILRLPGTINIPNQKKRAKGRTEQPASIIGLDTHSYELADFPLCNSEPTRAQAARPARARKTAKPLTELNELRQWDVTDETQHLIKTGIDLNEPEKWNGDRSKAVFSVVCTLIACDVPDAVIVGILLDQRWAIAGHVLDQPNPEQYAWRQIKRAGPRFARAKNGNIKCNQRNIRAAIEALGVHVWYDEFADQVIVEGLEGFGPRLDDAGLINLRLLVEDTYFFSPGREYFGDVIGNEARRNRRHPLRDRFSKLAWDGVPRLETWLIDCAGSADTPFVRAVSKITLVAAVRRIMHPGAKFDELLILESGQGTNKSSALKLLAIDEEYFLDGLSLNADSRQIMELTPGKLIVEFSELTGLRKIDIEAVKQMLSRASDISRLAYGRIPKRLPRQWIPVGTTNSNQYLRDQTGNRRFWPVRIQRFDLQQLAAAVDQLWAEAVVLERNGFSIQLPEELWGEAEAEQDARALGEPFLDTLSMALGDDIPWKVRQSDLWEILSIENSRRTKDGQERVASAMQSLGFEAKKRRFGENPVAAWVRGDGTEAFNVEDYLKKQRDTGAL